MTDSRKIDTNSFITSSHHHQVADDTTSPPLPQDSRFGVDKTTLLVDNSEHCGPMGDGWEPVPYYDAKVGGVVEHYRRTFQVGNGTVIVTVRLNRGHSQIQFNPSAILYGHNKRLTPPEALEPICKRVIAEITGEFWPVFIRVDSDGVIQFDEDWADKVRLKELELARDFLVDAVYVQPLFEALRHSPPRKRSQRQVIDAGPKSGWTIYHRTKSSGGDKIYDKTAELEAKGVLAANKIERQIRFEATLKSSRLDKFGLKRLSGISSTGVWQALESRFQASKFNVSLNSQARALKLLAGMTYSQREKAMGYLELTRLGLVSDLSPRLNQQRGKLVLGLGLSPGVGLKSILKESVKLDLFSGTLARQAT